MFAPPKKGTGKQLSKKRQSIQGTERKVDVKALVKDLSDSYRQLDDYVTKENEDKRQWNQHSPDKITSTTRGEPTNDTNGKQTNQKISATSSFTSKDVDSSTATISPRKVKNIYADDTTERRTDTSSIPEDVHSLLDAYPKKFQELRQIMEETKERHAKSINRLRQKLKKDALRQEEEAREAAKRDSQAEADKLRHLLKVQRTKSQRAMENMKIEKQKLVNSQAKSNRALRQTENKFADIQKGLFTIKKQLAKSQREKAMSDQDRVEQRSKAIKQKKRADELQRDIKSLESGFETVRLLNMQNENVTQHDYDVINWKFRSIVKLVREVESIATPPDLGKTPSLQTIIEATNSRGSRVRLPAIGYPRRLAIKGEQRAFKGRGQNRQIVYPQKKVVHQIPRRNDQNETKVKSNKVEMLALTMPEKKPDDKRVGLSTSDSTSTGKSRQSRQNDNEREKSDDYASDFSSENSSDSSIRKTQNSRNQSEMLALPMPETSPADSRESSPSTRGSTSDSGSTKARSALSQQSTSNQGSIQSANSDDKNEKSESVTPDDANQKSKREVKGQEDQGADDKEEDVSVFLT
ncbi:uncharacterized protein LOC105443967 [Strongylocentrotus purpuratus]|uniref:Uncharacterized protein n=1 Tax=Strongylocentrotus purpuratus TaxID=7668 RepID=A0A7M7HN60_STRPU|nr:uncharacterized protein LOC105443967 [Strongylocentrotus purpuratus]|eukprot:XP_011675980.1 PREDICTED: uncharacterized protein LOC105443967 [Strongylocentrotus purpuratus]